MVKWSLFYTTLQKLGITLYEKYIWKKKCLTQLSIFFFVFENVLIISVYFVHSPVNFLDHTQHKGLAVAVYGVLFCKLVGMVLSHHPLPYTKDVVYKGTRSSLLAWWNGEIYYLALLSGSALVTERLLVQIQRSALWPITKMSVNPIFSQGNCFCNKVSVPFHMQGYHMETNSAASCLCGDKIRIVFHTL